MPNRPAIPTDIERQVLLQAGFRCSNCGSETPIERAHIIPWAKTKDHAAENLVCLCANCHGRADTEKWGADALRRMKENPWVLRSKALLPQVESAAHRFAFLHQIKEPPNDFQGREKEIEELRADLERGRPVAICGLHGMGGVGKTTLAQKLAYELRAHYPDAQIYLDLKGVSKAPLSAAEAMSHVVRTFYPEASSPKDDTELEGRYRATLQGKRVLLLMDNAADAGQIEPLRPPEGCALLVTSRNRIVCEGLRLRDLDTLKPEEAIALLLEIAPGLGEAANEIARLCGLLPFALRLAGSHLAQYKALAPREYIRRLKETAKKFPEVDARLRLSYDLLPEDVQPLWRSLGIFPGSFDAAAAAAVWEVEEDRAARNLEELERGSLVGWTAADFRFRLHDLAREVARGLLGREEEEGARLRHARHFVKVLEKADGLYVTGGTKLLEGLRLFDREWENVRSAQAWASEANIDDLDVARICTDLPREGGYCLDLRLHPRELVKWLEVALTAARRLGDLAAEASHLNDLGIAYADLGETRRAIELYEQRLAIARESGNRRSEGVTLGNLGRAYADLGEARRAIELYEQRLAIAREIGDRRGEGNALGNLGNAYAVLGGIRRAIELFEQYLAIAREIGDRRGEGNALGSLGTSYANLDETQRAIELYEQWLAIAHEIGDRRGEGQALGNLGLAYANLGETQRAIELYEQQLAIAREVGDRRGEGNALGSLGIAYKNLGEIRRAIDLYERWLAIAGEIGDKDGEAKASWNLGLVLELTEPTRAAALMQVCVDFEQEIGHSDAENDAKYLAALRARLAAASPPPARKPRSKRRAPRS